MSVEYKDYYKTLGVSRTAKEDEIRKAFRKLAREYHPDVAKDKKGAEDKFKEINEAYEVLSDPAKREKYDMLGDWTNNSRKRAWPGGFQDWRDTGGQDFEFRGTGFSEFFEQLFGAMGSRGQSRGFAPASERGQDMEADLLVTLSEAVQGAVRKINLRRKVRCVRCDGSGRVLNGPCPTCNGQGVVVDTKTYQVRIPAGVRSSQRLRLAGQGEPGFGGGEPGDLYLRVKLAAHPDFSIQGSDLYYELHVAPWEAALGTNVKVPTLEKPVSIRIPPGTQTDQKFRVKGRGLPNREGGVGDLYVVVKLEMPKDVSGGMKDLWQKMAKESQFKPRE